MSVAEPIVIFMPTEKLLMLGTCNDLLFAMAGTDSVVETVATPEYRL
jgi:hypothetical protein